MKIKNNLIKRIGALLCALVVAVGCLYPSTFTFASVNSVNNADDYIELIGLKEHFSQTGYVYNPNCKYIVSAYEYSSYLHFMIFEYSSNYNPRLYVGDSCIFGYSGNIYSFNYYYNGSFTDYKGPNGSNFLTHVAMFKNDFNDNLFWYSDFPVYSDESLNNEVCGPTYWNKKIFLNDSLVESYKYNSQLGYLKSVTSKKMIIDGDNQGTQTKYKFTFDTVSSTGVDLTSGDYVVRLYEQTSIYMNGIWQPFETPKVHIADYSASSGSFSFNIAEALSKTDTVTGDIDGYNFLTIALNNYVRADTYWLQIYNTSTGEYGGFVQMKNNPNLQGQFTTSTVHGSEDDISSNSGTDTNGYTDKVVDTNIGIGTDYENAELDADRNDDVGGLDDVTGVVNDYVSTLSGVVSAISSVFSFLPSWCMDVFGISFALLGILIVYKLVRG